MKKISVTLCLLLAALLSVGCSLAGSSGPVYVSGSLPLDGASITSVVTVSIPAPTSTVTFSAATSSKDTLSAASSVETVPVSSGEISVPTDSSAVSESTDFTPDPAFDWALILVNKNSLLPDNYSVEVAAYNAARRFDARAVGYLTAMTEAAAADGIKLNVISSYRTPARQVELFDAAVEKYLKKGYSRQEAETEAAQLVAPPGTSEHCTGLAADIVSEDWYDEHTSLTDAFDQTDEYKWLAAHAAEYGFILRYPKGKEAVTMIDYEPWHYRFVGPANARYITDNGLTLEEFVALF